MLQSIHVVVGVCCMRLEETSRNRAASSLTLMVVSVNVLVVIVVMSMSLSENEQQHEGQYKSNIETFDVVWTCSFVAAAVIAGVGSVVVVLL